MHVFEMVAIIVACSLIASVINTSIKTKARLAENTGTNTDDAVLNKLALLEERVQVLERVITDDRHSLKSEIDNLD